MKIIIVAQQWFTLTLIMNFANFMYACMSLCHSHCTGEHPRLGALDICPFVPVANVTMEECAELSRRFGQHLATELGVPVYLYEYAVAAGDHHDYRRTLPQIRAGEYEGLEKKVH